MAKTFEVENKIANVKAHYNVVKGKLDQISQNINDAIELKEGYLLEIENLEDEISTKQNQLLGLRRALDETKIAQKESEDAIASDITAKRLIESQHEESVTVLIGAKEELEAAIEVHRKNLINICADEAEVELRHKRSADARVELITSLDREIEESKELIVEADNILSAKRDELISVGENIDDIHEELNYRETEIKEREEELKDISDDFNERTEKLETQEADIKVIIRRIKRKYEELYPGRNLII